MAGVAPHYTVATADNLQTRTGVSMVTLLTPRSEGSPFIYAGVKAVQPEMYQRAGLRERHTARDNWDLHYEASFVGTPVFSHLFYLIVLALLIVADLRRLARGDRRPCWPWPRRRALRRPRT